jgi:hypothetical protein
MMKQIGVLAILFVALLAAVIVKETSRPEAGSLRDQVSLQRLGPVAFTPEEVVAIEIAAPGGESSFALTRNDDVWLVEGAFRAPAAAGVVEQLLQAVSESRGELRLDDAAALAKFDLTPERASAVTLRNAAGTAVAQFALGRSSGTQGAFVRPTFDGVRDGAYAVSQDLRAALGLARTQPGDTDPAAPQAAHFHDVHMPNLALDDTARVEIVSPNWALAFEKAGAEWAAVEGAPDLPMRPAGIQQLVRTLGTAFTATSLVDPAERSALGLDDAAYRVTAVLADGTRRSVIGAADREAKRFFARLDVEQDPDVVYECQQYAFERLFTPGSQLFEFSSLGVENKGLGQVRIESVPETFAMTRAGNDAQADWTVVEPGWGLVPVETQVRNYVTLLNGVRPVDWYAGSEPFTEEAVVRYGAEEDDPATLTALRIGQAAPDGVGRLAILATAPERIVVLAESTVERLLPDVLSMFEARPLTGTVPADVTGVKASFLLRDSADPLLFELTRDDEGDWMVRHGEETSPGNGNAIASWLDDLIRVELEARSDYTGPAMYEIEVRRGDVVTTLGFGPAEGGTQPVMIGGAGFLADREIEVPEAASLVAEMKSGENPGDGTDPEDD